MPERFDAPPDPEKQAVREQVWAALTAGKAARFPGARGRIPNFVGAESAAALAGTLDVWRRARTLKCNPDAAQQPVRKLALQQGKTVYMAVPRLTELDCFVELDPRRLGPKLHQASTIKGAFAMGRRVGLEDMKPIDLIVCGSVAVDRRGGRIGKGGGYSDLEFAVATTAGKVGPGTAIITTVHPLQIIAGELPMHRHDIPLDVIVTPAEIIRCRRQPRPTGVYWDWLPEEKVAAIPVLQRMAPRRTAFTYVGLDPDWNVYRA